MRQVAIHHRITTVPAPPGFRVQPPDLFDPAADGLQRFGTIGQVIVTRITENDHRGVSIQLPFATRLKGPEHLCIISATTRQTIQYLPHRHLGGITGKIIGNFVKA